MIGHYLLFNRNCEQALEAYKEAFGGKIVEMKKFGDMPPNPEFPMAESDKNLVLHARLVIDNQELMCSDGMRVDTDVNGNNMYISITGDKAFIQKAWDILKQDGTVYMDLAPTFFAELHGSLQDQFGINWMFSAMK